MPLHVSRCDTHVCSESRHYSTIESNLFYKLDGYPKMAKQNGSNAGKKGPSGRSYRNATGFTRQPKKMRGRKVDESRGAFGARNIDRQLY